MSSRSRSPLLGQRRTADASSTYSDDQRCTSAASGADDNESRLDSQPTLLHWTRTLLDSQSSSQTLDMAPEQPCSPTLSDTSEQFEIWLAPKLETHEKFDSKTPEKLNHSVDTTDLETPEKPNRPIDTTTAKHRCRFQSIEEIRNFFAYKIGAEKQKAVQSGEQQPLASSGSQQLAFQSSDPGYLRWREQLEGKRVADQAAAFAPSDGDVEYKDEFFRLLDHEYCSGKGKN